MKKLLLILSIFSFLLSEGQVRINGTGTPIRVNKTGTTVRIITPTPSDFPFDTSGAIHKIIKTGGTVGVDCFDTAITTALARITDASISKQYILDVKNGTYNEKGTFDGAFGIYVGIYLKHYIHIIGESKAGVIVNGPQAAVSANETLVDVFHVPATCLIANLTINAQNCKYAFHCDYSSGNYEYDLYVKDCNVNHLGSVSGYDDAFGIGFHMNQSVTAIGCTITGEGFYAHGEIACVRDLLKPWHLKIKNCTMNNFIFQDYLEYSANTVTLTGNTIGVVNLQTITSVWDANPGSPTCNNGTKVYTSFVRSGNTVTTVTRDAETISILGTTMDDPTDF